MTIFLLCGGIVLLSGVQALRFLRFLRRNGHEVVAGKEKTIMRYFRSLVWLSAIGILLLLSGTWIK